MDLKATLEPLLTERTGETGGAIDEKFTVYRIRMRRKEPSVLDSICFGIDYRVQRPIFAVEPDQFPIGGNSI